MIVTTWDGRTDRQTEYESYTVVSWSKKGRHYGRKATKVISQSQTVDRPNIQNMALQGNAVFSTDKTA